MKLQISRLSAAAMSSSSFLPPDGGGVGLDSGGNRNSHTTKDNNSEEINCGKDEKEPLDKMTYSERLKTNVRFDQRLKRNVLEITLEKADADANLADVDEEAIA